MVRGVLEVMPSKTQKKPRPDPNLVFAALEALADPTFQEQFWRDIPRLLSEAEARRSRFARRRGVA